MDNSSAQSTGQSVNNRIPHQYPNKPYKENNPSNEPTGDFTGRCGRCGSNDLWDDNLSYGCNNCSMFKIGG